jgi:hypothetical protein
MRNAAIDLSMINETITNEFANAAEKRDRNPTTGFGSCHLSVALTC